ncbi:alpha/beta fold hydrolase [Methanobacterium sp. BAmetb5]|uniref:alpha/beta fold hydrolase n=1 Tax=Methanobacterium sp. BAmetb5 TaxID=2025351 RepID=UPI003428D3BA
MTCNLTGHIQQICDLVISNNLQNIILVGHSYGGMIITGVTSKILERIDRLVYLDADWPDPGQSLFDVLKLSGLGPEVAIPGLEPSLAYVEKIQYDPEKAKSLKKFFYSLTPKVTSPSSGIL